MAFTEDHLTTFYQEIVMQQPNGKFETLAEVLARLNLAKERLTIESLDVEVYFPCMLCIFIFLNNL